MTVAGGWYNSGVTPSSGIYDPVTGLWRTTDAMTASRCLFTATLLPNGKVLATGGYTNSGSTRSAELFDR